MLCAACRLVTLSLGRPSCTPDDIALLLAVRTLHSQVLTGPLTIAVCFVLCLVGSNVAPLLPAHCCPCFAALLLRMTVGLALINANADPHGSVLLIL